MFALVDCNSFYASCERVFRPDLIDKPVAVLSNNDGCVIARTTEVKALDIPMGAVAHKFKNVFEKNNVHVFSSNYALYADLSNRVMNILRRYVPDVEVYSIDEAFLKFNGFNNFNLKTYCLDIKSKVYTYTKIPVSIGVAPTKALAKVANKIAKKYQYRTQGVYVIDNENKRIKALKWTKIEDVWGIGRRIAKRLKAKNVDTAYEFTMLPTEWVRKEFSVVGVRLQRELKGLPTLEMEEVKSKKNIATTRSFENNITTIDSLKERVATFAVSCAEKLRQQYSCTQLITVFVKTNSHRKDQPQYGNSVTLKLPYPTNSNITISKYAQLGLQYIFKSGYSYKKAGVIVGAIAPQNAQQLNLFEAENPKHDQLMKTIDRLNQGLSKSKLKLGSQSLGRTWKMRQEHLSKQYTTSWEELLEVY